MPLNPISSRRFSAEQRETLRKWLEARAETLRGELDEDLHQDLNAEPERAAAVRDADELRDVEAALERLEQAEFGRCAECGNEIAFERLRANPAAAYCIDCQPRHEHARGA